MTKPDEKGTCRERAVTPVGGRGTANWVENAQTRPSGSAAVRSDTPTRIVDLVSTGAPTQAVDNDELGSVSGQEIRALTELNWNARVLAVLAAAESIRGDWDVELETWAGRVLLPVRNGMFVPAMIRVEDGEIWRDFEDGVRGALSSTTVSADEIPLAEQGNDWTVLQCGDDGLARLQARALLADELVRVLGDSGHPRVRAARKELWNERSEMSERPPVSPAECLIAHNRRLARYDGERVSEVLARWQYRRIGVSNGAGAALRVVAGNQLRAERVSALSSLPSAFEKAMWVYARTTGQWAASGPLVVGSGASCRLFASDAGGGWVVDAPLGEVGAAARALNVILGEQ